mmetsp:Transcript_132611/g.383357  ORF Transcript_132611/g.383357 Transcript_132611/m.383357 type:complete len:388 (-) Transcript_132611:251-1414(-)
MNDSVGQDAAGPFGQHRPRKASWSAGGTVMRPPGGAPSTLCRARGGGRHCGGPDLEGQPLAHGFERPGGGRVLAGRHLMGLAEDPGVLLIAPVAAERGPSPSFLNLLEHGPLLHYVVRRPRVSVRVRAALESAQVERPHGQAKLPLVLAEVEREEALRIGTLHQGRHDTSQPSPATCAHQHRVVQLPGRRDPPVELRREEVSGPFLGERPARERAQRDLGPQQVDDLRRPRVQVHLHEHARGPSRAPALHEVVREEIHRRDRQPKPDAARCGLHPAGQAPPRLEQGFLVVGIRRTQEQPAEEHMPREPVSVPPEEPLVEVVAYHPTHDVEVAAPDAVHAYPHLELEHGRLVVPQRGGRHTPEVVRPTPATGARNSSAAQRMGGPVLR